MYEIGNGAIAPIIALTALDLGSTAVTAGYMVALLGIGRVLGNVPSSWVTDHLGDRRAMLAASAMTVVALVVCLVSTAIVPFAAALLVIGACTATFYLARQTYVSEVVPLTMTARALSTLAGAHRIGLFIGPFLGAAAIALLGLHAAYGVAIVTTALTAVVLLVVKDAATASDRPQAVRKGGSTVGMFRAHQRLFLTLGLCVFAVGAVRAARQTAIPLWAEHVGIGPETTSLIFGVASFVDMTLFYPAGHVMDRYGRLSVALPAMTILGGAMMVLPLTHGLVAVSVVAIAMSVGNGIGSGIIMTLGADASPRDHRSRFLSLWRVMTDTGNAGGPILISLVAMVSTLGAGIAVTGSLGVLAAVGMARWLPRYSPLATRADVRRAGAAGGAGPGAPRGP
jgi:MFS family permease